MSILVVENSILKKRKYDLNFNDNINYKHHKSNDNKYELLNDFFNKIIKRIDNVEDVIKNKINELDDKLILIDKKLNDLNIGYSDYGLFKNDCPYIS